MADNPIGLLHKHVTEEPKPLAAAMNELCPAGLENVLVKAMAKEPARRYQSANDFKKDLQLVLEGNGASIKLPALEKTKKLPLKMETTVLTVRAVCYLFCWTMSVLVLVSLLQDLPETEDQSGNPVL